MSQFIIIEPQSVETKQRIFQEPFSFFNTEIEECKRHIHYRSALSVALILIYYQYILK
jgi:hypothetical protein